MPFFKMSNTSKSTLLQCTFFLVVLALFISSNWMAISAVNFEVGDFATNSTLVQDAKKLSLLVGNYSRVGFNHPGPAILYVLAFGEFFFHDWLGWVKSAFSGQLIAVALYNAFWVTLAFRVFSKVSNSSISSLLAVSAFLFALSSFDHQTYTGIWFPELYILPFAVFILCCSRLISGKVDTLQSMAISMGFLVNGHVSFVAILGIMLVVSLTGNWLVFKAQCQERRILSADFLSRNWATLMVALATFLIFLVPLLIKTIVDFPGPVASYAKFSGGHEPNTLAQAWDFVAIYWMGGAYSALAAGLFLWLASYVVKSEVGVFSKAALVTCVSATLAMLFYAKFGVDMLDQHYIGLFYYSVPSLAVGIFGLCVTQLRAINGSPRPAVGAFTIVTSIGLLFLMYGNIHKPANYAVAYNQPRIVELFDSLQGLKSNSRVVLNLDNRQDWANVWANMQGLTALTKRKGLDLFCIGRNWDISFTPAMKCTPEELASSMSFVVSRDPESSFGNDPALFQSYDLSFFKYVEPNIVDKGVLSVRGNPKVFSRYILGRGWSTPDAEFVWSEGKESTLSIQAPKHLPLTIVLDASAFIPDRKYTQQIQVSVNDQPPQSFSFTSENNRKPLEVFYAGGDTTALNIKILNQNPIAPREAGGSSDFRKLGIALFGISVQGVQREQ